MAPAKWPIRSRGLAVHPSQVEEMKRLFPHHKYDPKTGHLIVESQREFDQVRADLGFVDLEGYGTSRVSREGHRMAVARLQEEAERRAKEAERRAEDKEAQVRLAARRARIREALERFLRSARR